MRCWGWLAFSIFSAGYFLGLFSGYKMMKPEIDQAYVIDVVTIITRQAVKNLIEENPRIPFGSPVENHEWKFYDQTEK